MEHGITDEAPSPRSNEANALQREILEARESMQSCFREMETVLAGPSFDAGALTSVRLKLAGIRLSRGPLVMKVAAALAGKVTQKEAAILEQLRASHQRLLQTATVHTSKWTLDAIAADWAGYRRETQKLMRQWTEKAEHNHRLVHPLIRRCADERN